MSAESEVLIEEQAVLSQEVDVEMLVETVTEREVLVESSSELLVENETVCELLEVTETEMLVETQVSTELLEIGIQGPPGPQGVAGEQGLPGLPGDANLGGLEIYVQDPQPGDILALDPTNTWTNQRPDGILDGGNF